MWWAESRRNPQVDLQAQDRAHRIGQKKEVQVFRFCTEVKSSTRELRKKNIKNLKLILYWSFTECYWGKGDWESLQEAGTWRSGNPARAIGRTEK